MKSSFLLCNYLHKKRTINLNCQKHKKNIFFQILIIFVSSLSHDPYFLLQCEKLDPVSWKPVVRNKIRLLHNFPPNQDHQCHRLSIQFTKKTCVAARNHSIFLEGDMVLRVTQLTSSAFFSFFATCLSFLYLCCCNVTSRLESSGTIYRRNFPALYFVLSLDEQRNLRLTIFYNQRWIFSTFTATTFLSTHTKRLKLPAN